MLYTCHISLDGIEPKIWRRFRFHSEITFRELHRIVQAVMGWEDYHLFEFEIGDRTILLPDPTYPPEGRVELNARREIVAKHLASAGQTMRYTYDMGDNWQHTMILEKIEPAARDSSFPICLDGKRNCPQGRIGRVDDGVRRDE